MGTAGESAEFQAERIRELCKSWREAAYHGDQPDWQRAVRQYALTSNGFLFHELSYEGIREACIGLTKVLMSPGQGQIIMSPDHDLFWAWGAEVLLRSDGYFSYQELELRELCETAVRAALATIDTSQLATYPYSAVQARELVSKSHLVLAYLCFPLLEGVLKKACSDYVDYSGMVRQAFKVRGQKYKPYNPEKPGGGYTQCSRIGDLLRLLHKSVANEELRSALEDVLKHLESLRLQERASDGFSLLDEWRNQSLHGQATHQTIGGTLLYMVMLIALDGVKDRYEKLTRPARWFVRQGGAGTGGFYPPYPIHPTA